MPAQVPWAYGSGLLATGDRRLPQVIVAAIGSGQLISMIERVFDAVCGSVSNSKLGLFPFREGSSHEAVGFLDQFFDQIHRNVWA